MYGTPQIPFSWSEMSVYPLVLDEWCDQQSPAWVKTVALAVSRAGAEMVPLKLDGFGWAELVDPSPVGLAP